VRLLERRSATGPEAVIEIRLSAGPPGDNRVQLHADGQIVISPT